MASIILISGASGIGKDYVTDRVKGNTKSLQMTTQRPSRGAGESKICITTEEYRNLQENRLLIGDHINDTGYSYGYDLNEIGKFGKEEVIIMEVNPADQSHLYNELIKRGIEVKKWIGFTAEPDYITINMIIRNTKISGSTITTEPTISELITILNEQAGYEFDNSTNLSLTDIAKEMGLGDIDDRLRMSERLNKAIRENTDIEEVHVGWDNRAEIVEEFRTSYGELFTQKDSNPEKL